MFLFGIMFMSVVRVTGDDPTTSCGELPDAPKCVGTFAWDPTLQSCKCFSRVPWFEYVVPTNQTSDGRRYLKAPRRHYFLNCFPGQSKSEIKILKMGILVDRGFYQKSGNDKVRVQRYVHEIIDFANTIFEEQFSVRFRIDQF
eukprot:GEMP01123840.1.p1 GENE.GEMP01123840.1~~GEMP01123840.1.p1  ORF type:complete len:143 (+),score=20.84 GEMP01123840.1:125-553(+)